MSVKNLHGQIGKIHLHRLLPTVLVLCMRLALNDHNHATLCNRLSRAEHYRSAAHAWPMDCTVPLHTG